jgi:hypothetical protein
MVPDTFFTFFSADTFLSADTFFSAMQSVGESRFHTAEWDPCVPERGNSAILENGRQS